MAILNLENGNPRANIDMSELAEHEEEIKANWLALMNVMDDGLCERVHGEIAPCTELEFLARYLALANEDIVVG